MRGRWGVLVVFMSAVSAASAEPNPLPAGAVRRLGTAAFRNLNPQPVGLLPPRYDGFVVRDPYGDGFRVLDPATGGLRPGTLASADEAADEFLAASADGKRGLSRTEELYYVWDIASGKRLAEVSSVNTPPGGSAVSMSADGRFLAYGSHATGDGKPLVVTVYDVNERRVAAAVTAAQSATAFAALSPDGRRLATFGADTGPDAADPDPAKNPNNFVEIWSVPDRKRLGRAVLPSGSTVPEVAFAPDGNTVALLAGGRGPIGLFDAATGEKLRDFTDGQGRPKPFEPNPEGHTIAFGPDGRSVAAVTDSGRAVWFWDAATGRLTDTVTGPPISGMTVGGLAYLAPARVVVWGTVGAAFTAWETPGGRFLTAPHYGHTGPVEGVGFAADGSFVTVSTMMLEFLRWTPDGLPDGRLDVDTDWLSVLPVGVSGDGRRVIGSRAVVGPGGKVLCRLNHPENTAGSLVPSPNDQFGAVACSDPNPKAETVPITAWDLTTGAELGRVRVKNVPNVRSTVAVSSTGKRLSALVPQATNPAAFGFNRTFVLTVWELPSGKKIGEKELTTDDFGPNHLTFADDKTLVVSLGGSVSIVDADVVVTRRVLEFGASSATGPAAVSPDGKFLAVPVVTSARNPAAPADSCCESDTTAMEIFLYACPSGAPVKRFTASAGPTAEVISFVRFSPDGTRLATATADTTAVIWDVTAPGGTLTTKELAGE